MGKAQSVPLKCEGPGCLDLQQALFLEQTNWSSNKLVVGGFSVSQLSNREIAFRECVVKKKKGLVLRLTKTLHSKKGKC